jgi:hypothetical protein
MSGSISVIEGARAAFAALGSAWRRAAGALALAGLLSTAAILALVDRQFGRTAALLAAYLLAAAMARGALFRLARRPHGETPTPGFAGFQWDALEWRLLAVALLRAALFGLLGALAITLFVALYIGIAAAEAGRAHAITAPEHWRRTLDPVGWSVVGAATLACAAGIGWIAMRLYLGFAATARQNQVRLLSTWPLTRGQVLRLLGGVVLITAPMAALVLAMRIGRDLIPADDLGGWRLGVGIVCFGQAFLALPLSVGLMTYFHSRLAPDDAGVR